MKNLMILFVMSLSPAVMFAHPSLAPHEHHGFLNGWEMYVIFPALILLMVFVSRKMLKTHKARK